MKRTACRARISVLNDASEDELSAIAELVRQLRTDGQPAEIDNVRAVIAPTSRESRLLVARDRSGKILGVTTLVVYRTLLGTKARIEDVVVAAAARRQGIAEKLHRAALHIAHGLNADSITLTSNPAREAANALYLKLGYALYETNVYVRKP